MSVSVTRWHERFAVMGVMAMTAMMTTFWMTPFSKTHHKWQSNGRGFLRKVQNIASNIAAFFVSSRTTSATYSLSWSPTSFFVMNPVTPPLDFVFQKVAALFNGYRSNGFDNAFKDIKRTSTTTRFPPSSPAPMVGVIR